MIIDFKDIKKGIKIGNIEDIKHGYRVAELSKKMAKAISLNRAESLELYISALFHDIGKIFLDQDILNKPGDLNYDEKKHINLHSLFGAEEVLKLGFSTKVTFAVLHHHENFDGTGYPKAIEGKEIPLFSRIIRIADAYDAMTTDRPYREKMSHEDAIKTMKNESIYDPELFQEFINIWDTNNFLILIENY